MVYFEFELLQIHYLCLHTFMKITTIFFKKLPVQQSTKITSTTETRKDKGVAYYQNEISLSD